MTSTHATTRVATTATMRRRWRICHGAELAGKRWDRVMSEGGDLTFAAKWLTRWTVLLAREVSGQRPAAHDNLDATLARVGATLRVDRV